MGPHGGGPAQGFIAKGGREFGVNKELTCKWERRKRVGPGRREFRVSGQTLLGLDWGAVNQRPPRGQRRATKRTKMAHKESPRPPPT